MKSFSLVALLILLFVTVGNAQSVCFEDFQNKVVIPLRQAFDNAQTDKERDSLIFEPSKALKQLEGCSMPEFTAQTLTGKSISKQSLKGKVVVMNFWYIGCKPCVAELPALNKLVEQYKGKEVVFIAFGNSTQQLTVQEFLPKHEFKFQLVTDSEAYADKFFATAAGFPTSMVFDQNGLLRYVSSGGFTDERAKTAIFNKISPVINTLLTKK